ncbi:MAG: ECF transporter S component [Promethearchaeota archaeon]
MVEGNDWTNRLSFRLALLAILTALTTVLTMVVSIPIPATQGYINLGDAGVLLSGLLLGPLGGIAGGLGSALADYALGYIHYIPITFVVKGLEGVVTGTIFWVWKPVRRVEWRLFFALIAGSVIMVSGYLIAETLMYGFAAAIVEVPGNIFQVTFGSIVGAVAFLSVDRVFKLTFKQNNASNDIHWFSPRVM